MDYKFNGSGVFYILEWSATEPDDIGMIEVGIGCKELEAELYKIFRTDHDADVH